MTENQIKEEWVNEYKSRTFNYFVLKISDLFKALHLDELYLFHDFLDKYNNIREPKPISDYWIIDRKDVPNIKTYEEFLDKLEVNKHENNSN